MSASYQDRIERLKRLEALIPLRSSDWPDTGRLLERLGTTYGSGGAGRRAIQRDLKELVEQGRIEPVDTQARPLCYRRVGVDLEGNPNLWAYARRTLEALVQEMTPGGRLDAIWHRLIDADHDVGLGPDRIRVITDTQRLLPAQIHDQVLVDALEALARSLTLRIGYRDREGKVTRPVIHPQALLQRGPRIYLFALKNDETDPVRMYALHRITSSELGEEPARRAEGFDLDEAVKCGQADFASGQQVDLRLRVRGYVADLLRDCPLSSDQRLVDEPEGSDFDVEVRATVPATGQLLRWVLGGGANIEVLAPEDLRKVVMEQMRKGWGIYGGDADTDK